MMIPLVLALTGLTGAWQQDPVVSADSMLHQIDAKKPPAFLGDTDDYSYKKNWTLHYLRYLDQRNDMIWTFVKTYPDHQRAKPLMEEWFQNLSGGTSPAVNERIGKAILDIDSLLVKIIPDWVTVMGRYYRAYYLLCGPWNRLIELDGLKAPADDAERRAVIAAGMRIIQQFVEKYPKENRGARLYDILAEACHDPVSARSIYARVIQDYPESPNKALYEAKMKRLDKIGDPFTFAFDDALTGDPVGSEQYKGKVLLVVFWAHEILECRKKMDDVKRVWFKYQKDGLEVIDISLDGTADDRKRKYVDFVHDNHLDWHHYFQSEGIRSPFSMGWGINALPTWFLVDRKGALRYVDAQLDTETKVKELLKEDGGH